jgi:UDP-2,3-diacylglucosamine pyrophosphatase LpxH
LKTGFQICHSYSELVGFVDWLVALGHKGLPEDLELVINGDIVDFLAEDDFSESLSGAQIWTIKDEDAVTKLDRVSERTRNSDGRCIFDALKDFLAVGHRLTLLIGNHDVELSLPTVRARLAQLLGDETARLRFIYDGEAYIVGRVLIEHGNRYDRWNMIGYSALRQERSMRSRGLPIDEAEREERYFVPPAGTYLVIHFMNRIKARYRFIDLLKPEDSSMIPLLLALEPERRKHLKEILNASPVIRNYVRHGLRTPVVPKDTGDLEARNEAEREITLQEILEETLGEDAKYFSDVDVEEDDGDLAAESDREYEEDLSDIIVEGARGSGEDNGVEDDMSIGQAVQLVGAAFTGTINWFSTRYNQYKQRALSASNLSSLFFNAKNPEVQPTQLYAALKHLNHNDPSFDIEFEYANYLQAATETAAKGDFDVIVYGHTHLPKKKRLSLPNSAASGSAYSCWYMNTGTWCDVIRLPEAMTGDYKQAVAALKVFAAALRCNDYSRYIHRYLSFVEMVVDPTGSQRVKEPQLYSYCGPGRERSSPLTDILGKKEVPNATDNS